MSDSRTRTTHPDPLTTEQRRLNMSRIRGRDTKPEMVLRRGLHARGFRYRLHVAGLPGKPDMVFPRYNTVVFVHGCFWHGHDCALFRLPSTNAEFWEKKIFGNTIRDEAANASLLSAGWHVITIWECALRGKEKLPLDRLLDRVESSLKRNKPLIVIRGSAAA